MFNCPMKPNFEERKPNLIPSLGADDVKKIAIYHQYQGPQYCQLQHGHLPSGGSLALNDMSKQVQVLPSSFFSPGTVPGPGSQQYQTSISGSSVAVPGHGHCSQQPTLVQQSQGQQMHPWAQAGIQQSCHNHRQPVPHQWTRSAQLNVVTPTPSNQYGNQVQNMVYPHLVNPFNSQLAGQPTMFMASSPLPMAVNYGHQRSQYTPQPQYAISSSQQMYISSGGPSTYNYTVSQSPMYYPQLSTQRFVSGCPFPVNGQSGNISGIKKEKSIIRIGDPVTGRDVTEEVLLNKENSVHPDFQDPGETSSESSHSSHEIVVQFTSKVAALATLNVNNKPEIGMASTGSAHSDPQTHGVNGLPQVNHIELSKQDILKEARVNDISCNSENIFECYDAACDDNACSASPEERNKEGHLKFISANVICSENKPSNVLKPVEPSPKVEFVEMVNCTKADPKVEKEEYVLSGSDENIYAHDIKQNKENPSSQCNEVAHSVEHVDEKENINDSLPNDVCSGENPPVAGLAHSEISENTEKNIKVQSTPVSSCETIQPPVVTEASLCEENIIEGKESRKNRGRRKKDLNKKGENKEGGDMDAFLDKNEEIGLKTPPAPPTSPAKISPVSESQDPTVYVNNKLEELEITPDKKEECNTVYSEEDKNLEENFDNTKLQTPLTLKYNYKEDQWSPLNPEGKKHYDREFLLHLQSQPMSLRKPSNLPNLEVIKDKAIHHRLPDIIKTSVTPLQPRPPDLFIPHFVGGRSSRPPHSGVSRRQSQQGRDKPKKIITISTSLSHDVKLHESENAWKPSMLIVQNEASDIKTQELYRRVKGILNKLTPQKFQTLVSQVKQLEINTEERLKGVIDLVFEKAVDEPNFSVPYANMCKQLAMLKVPLSENTEGEFVNFRKLLLTKCQREFEMDHSDETQRKEKLKEIEQAETEEKKRQIKESLEEEERQSRRRSLGNIRFIGELFKLGMLTEPIMHGCVKRLLSQGDEDSLECLCRLLTTIGKELEDKIKSSKDNSNSMAEYFKEMKKIVEKRQVTPRVRFMLQDVIDLRQNAWVPRWNENNPKTIDQIHREAEQEAQEKQQLLQQVAFQPRNVDRDRRKGRNNPPLTDDSWTMSASKNKANYSVVDPMKLKLTKPTEVENIQLQPGNRPFNWRCGSSGGVKSSAQDIELLKTSVLSNRFHPLSSDQGPPIIVPKRASQRSTASSRESSRGRGNQPPFSSIRKTPSQTSSKEREQLIEAVKDLTRSGTIEQKPQANKKVIVPQEANVNEVNGKGADVNLKGANLSKSEIERKTIPIIDEFLHNCDFTEAIHCVTEITSLANVHIFISEAINHVLERSSQARHLLGELLHKLLKQNIIYMEQYIKGLKAVLEVAEDCAIDVPMIWEYLGELIEPVIEDSTIPLSFLKETAKPLIASGTAGKLVSAVLHSAVKKRGTIKVGELWRDAGLKWSDFLSSEENIQKFVENHKLEFTVHCMDVHPVIHLSPTEVKKQLQFLLHKKQADNEEIFDWIEANVGEKKTEESWFIRALITAVVESAIQGEDASSSLDQKKIKHRISLLQRYLDHREHLEIQALYALQALMDQLHHPKGLLKHIFDNLYDEDLISEDAFKQWEKCDDPAEQGGKGVALHSVSSFFKWLQEADEESSNEN